MTIADLRARIARHRVESEAAAVSFLALVVFVVLAIRVGRALEPARLERAKLEAVSAEIAGFEGAFKPFDLDESQRVADSLGVGVPRDQRTALAHEIAANAEALGLGDVRVRFAVPDSATAPQRPDVSRTTVGIADYTIAVECSGAFANVLTLINRLPASVALQRIVATNANGRTRYRVALAVFETTAAPSVGVANGEVAPHE